ncbi:ABC transporter permease [Geofilum rubicundum]|uniref:Putative ABC transporter permease n=1 Tax=Geofilum rubicundum JCM 15548 TaxID=1236989 RepID=A0A0E9LTL1_9BACT|nr:ABC transporter permease [Geofilum rubicundum]GAO28200.1 putative ABC transporter permease [Geofilum rubicundum JCM 15548]
MRFLNFIKTFFRTILLHSGFSLLTLLGLSIGIAMSLLVLIYVYYEANYDRHWENSESIYRVYSYGEIGEDKIRSAVTPLPLSDVLREQEGVATATRLVPGNRKLVSSDYLKSLESYFFYADTDFFDIFEMPFLLGEPENALKDSNSVVITFSAAQRLFGQRNPLGEKLTLENGLEYIVTAMVEDVPANSHMRFDFIGNWLQVENRMRKDRTLPQAGMLDNWLYLNSYTYFKSRDTAAPSEVLHQLSIDAVQKVDAQIVASFKEADQSPGRIYLNFGIQPIHDIHLYSQVDNEMGPVANPDYIAFFTAIAFFILLITAINFMNLTTAKASRRFKEVAVRKYFGAGRRFLVYQFLTEAVVYSFVALFVALVLVELLLPGFNTVFGIGMTSTGFIQQPDTIWILVITMLLGVLSGSYPALFFSGLKPHLAINGVMKVKKWGVVMRGLLVSFQVILSISLIVLSLGMYGQWRFLEDAPHGFDDQDAVVLEWGSMDREGLRNVKSELKSSEHVNAIGMAEYAPGDDPSVISFRSSGDSSQVVLLAVNYVDSGYFDAMDVTFVKGGVWEAETDSDKAQVVINAAAARFLGYDKNEQLTLELVGGRSTEEPYMYTVAGVIEDLAFAGVKEAVRPMIFLQESASNRAEHLIVGFNSGTLEKGVEELNRVWKNEVPDRAIKLKYLSEIKADFYSEERRFANIATMFSLLALVLTIFGKIGMAAFVVQYHQKHIFIRSLMAAPFIHLLEYGLRGYWVYILFGMAVGLPVSSFLLHVWLSGFELAYVPDWTTYLLPILVLCLTSALVAYFAGGREIKKEAYS